MSVIVRGMEMPENCAICPLHKRFNDPTKRRWCGHNGKTLHHPYRGKPKWCPLFELKDWKDL